jgi:hypothetical protein
MLKDNSDITICLTSAGRWKLLEKTISSLVSYWDGTPPADFFIHEDRGDIPAAIHRDLERFIYRHWKLTPKVLFSYQAGQVSAIDRVYKAVKTPYIFHCEDDWEFYQTGFIADSRSVLEAESTAACVWIRHPNDRNGHTILPEMKLTKDGVRYQQLAQRYRGSWHGMTWSPGLRRLSDYQKVGKFGEFCEWRSNDHIISEMQYNKKYYEAGYVGMTLCRGFIKHIGHLDSLKKNRR